MPAPTNGFDWYVFRVSYGRADKACEQLRELVAANCYFHPTHTVYFRTSTGVKSAVEPLMPYFIFAFLSEADARLFANGPSAHDDEFLSRNIEEQSRIHRLNELLSFYYNHTQTLSADNVKNPPLTIPHKQMLQFLNVTQDDAEVIKGDTEDFEIGEMVRVTKGKFEGLTGMVIRKEKNKKKLYIRLSNGMPAVPPPFRYRDGRQRILVNIPTLGSFGSAYIPVSYFEKI